jgi:hypothetical protein
MDQLDIFHTPHGQQRNPARIPVVLEAIREIWEKNPDLRLGQLIYIAVNSDKSTAPLFSIEDAVLLQCLTEAFPVSRNSDER